MMKQILCIGLVMIMLIGLLPQYAIGVSGAEMESPHVEAPEKRDSGDIYFIYTAEDLNNIREDLAGRYTLMNDISLAEYNWNPIGTSSNPFTGYFDGNGYSIYGLNIRIENNTNQRIGLFGQMAGGTICNLNLVGGTIFVKGKNSKNVHIGSFCGHMHDSRIINCTSSVSIVAQDNRRLEIGGIVGTIDQIKVSGKSMIWNCHNSGYIRAYVEEYQANSPHCNAAGICGYARSDISGSTIDFKGCSNSGDITSFSENTQAHAAGIVAYASSQNGASLYIDRCYNTGRVEADNNEVSGQRYVGGMAAYSEALYSNSKTIITDCYNAGTVGGGTVGGLAGRCYELSATHRIMNSHNIGYIYTLGKVTYKGHIVGSGFQNETSNCYYVQAAGEAGGLTIGALGMESSFKGFDFKNTWYMGSDGVLDYPMLYEVNVEDIENPYDGIKQINSAAGNAGLYVYSCVGRVPVGGVNISVAPYDPRSSSSEEIYTTVTDGNGIAGVPADGERYELTFSKKGYQNYYCTMTLNEGEVYSVIMKPEATIPTVFAVELRYDGEEYGIDIMQSKRVIDETDNRVFSLVAIGGYTKAIEEYWIIQDGRVVKKSTNGYFADMTASDFGVSSNIYFCAVGSDGVKGKYGKSNLIIQDNHLYSDLPSFRADDNIQFMLPQDFPIIGGKAITLDLGSLPLYMELNGDEVRIAVNMVKTEVSTDGTIITHNILSKNDNVWKSFKQSVVNGIFKSVDGLEMAASGGGVSVGDTDVKFNIWGYLEGSAVTGEVSGEIKVVLDASSDQDIPFTIGVVPMVITFGVKAGGEATLNGSMNIKTWSDAKLVGKLSPYAQLSIGVGPGFADLASVTINAGGTLGIDYIRDPQVGNTNQSWAKLSAFIRAKVLFAEWEKILSEKTYILEEKTTRDTKNAGISISDAMDLDHYKIADRSYLEHMGTWRGDVLKKNVARESFVLQSSIYDDTQLEVVRVGDSYMMFFLTDNPDRNDIDRTMLVYTIYDPIEGSWSVPKAVDDDGTADFFPEVVSDGDDVYVTWTNFEKTVDDMTANYEEIASCAEIKLASYNIETDKFDSIVITNDEVLDCNSKIMIRGGAPVVMWTKNRDSGMLLNNDANELWVYNGGTQITECITNECANLVESAIGSLDGEIYISYTTDTDGDYSTVNDRVMNVVALSDKSHGFEIANEYVASPTFYEDKLYWLQNGQLQMRSALSAENSGLPVFQMVTDYRIVEMNGYTYFLFLSDVVDEGTGKPTTEVFAYVYNNQLEQWGSRIQLTNFGRCAVDFASFDSGDGNIKVLVTATEVSEEEGAFATQTNLYEATVVSGNKCSIKSLEYSDPVAFEEGCSVAFNAVIENMGTRGAKNLCLVLVDGEGNKLDTITITEEIVSGGNITVTDTFRTSITPSKEKQYYVMLIDADSQEQCGAPHEIAICEANLSITCTGNTIVDDFYVLNMVAKNDGILREDAIFEVRVGNTDGERISVQRISLEPNESKGFIVEVDAREFDFDREAIEMYMVLREPVISVDAKILSSTFFVVYQPHVHELTMTMEELPDCEKDGFREYLCEICGYTYAEKLPLLGHSYEVIASQDATCTEAGYQTRLCSICQYSVTQNYEALGHSYVYTNHRDGTHERICERMDDSGVFKHEYKDGYCPCGAGMLFFDFTADEAATQRYATSIYGGHNYDKNYWFYNSNRNNAPVFSGDAGTMRFTMPAKGESPYIQTTDSTGSATAKPLAYHPGENDVCQIRLKISNCKAIAGKNPLLRLYVIKDSDADVTSEGKPYTKLTEDLLQMNGFATVTIPLKDMFAGVEIVKAIRVVFSNVIPSGSGTASIEIDYIYVGPEENVPIDDHLYFGFESSPEDQERYSGKTYTNHNFDTGSWLVRRANNEMHSAKFEDGTMSSVLENATAGCYFETGEKVTDNWLVYDPRPGDYVQARLKIESSNTENDTKSPIVFFIFSENGEQKVDSEGPGMSPATRIKLPKGAVNQGYQTITIPLHPDTVAAYDIGSMRIAIEGVNYVPGDKITIDYIYVGQYDTLPSEVAKVVFSNEDGTTLYEHFVSPGEKTTYQGATPAKAADTQGHYVFDGTWKTASGEIADLTTIAEPVTLYPSFRVETHTGVLRNEIAPTCMAEGYSGDLYCEICGYLMESGTNVEPIDHSYNEEGLCVCGKAQPIQEPTWKLGRSLNLASDISINFAVSKASLSGFDMDTIYVRSELDVYEGNVKTGVKTIEIRPEDKGNYYYFTLSGLTAVNMNDTVRSVLYGTKDGQEYCSAIDEYSIATYAYTQMNKASISESLKVLCADLLRYGAKAQIYKGYRTDFLADANMTEEQTAYLSDLDAVELNPTNTVLNDVPNAPMKWEGKALDLASKVTVKFIFSMGSYAGKVEDLTLNVSYEGVDGTTKTLTLQNGEMYHSKYNFYAFTLDALLAAELRSVLSVQIYDGETPVSCTQQYAAETYGNNKTGVLGDLCKALFAYSDSAKEFFK